MIPILYAYNETKFETNGLGALVDCISCTVIEERNGEFTCEFEYPIDAPMFSKIKPGCIVYVDHDASRKPQPFDIYAYEVTSDGIATFRARHVSYRLQYSICHPVNMPNAGASVAGLFVCRNNDTIKMNDVPRIGFNWKGKNTWDDPQDNRTRSMGFVFDTPRTSRDILLGADNSIVSLVPGEYKWDVWDVIYYFVGRGRETDTVIRFGINVPGLSYEYNIDDSYDAAIPYWNGSGEVQYLDGDESFIDSGSVYADSATVGAGGTGDFYLWGDQFRAMTVDLTDKFKSRPSALNLLKAVEKYADENVVQAPYENFKLDYRALRDSPEYDGYVSAQDLCLCDYATIVFPEIGHAKPMKLVKTTYDPLLERYDKLEFGSVSRGIYTANSTINTVQYTGNIDVIDVDDGDLPSEPIDPEELEEI